MAGTRENSDCAILAENLSLKLGAQRIFENAELKVEWGEKVVVFGESGSGKSSLLKTLIGVHRPQRGTVEIAGYKLCPKNLSAIRRSLFYLPQEIRPLGEETTHEFISMFYKFVATRDRRPERERILELFETFKLREDLLVSRLSSLSGGERQRVGLIRGMLLEPQVVLLDEATSAIDEENSNIVADWLLKRQEMTLLAVSHERAFIERTSKQVEVTAGQIRARSPQEGTG